MTNCAGCGTGRPLTRALEEHAAALALMPSSDVSSRYSAPAAGPHARGTHRSPAGTSACRRPRHAGWRRPATGAHASASSRNGSPESWRKKLNPRFRPHADAGMAPLPRAPFRERPDRGRSYRSAQLLEQQVGERRRRLADGEPGVPAALEQRDRRPCCAARAPSASRQTRTRRWPRRRRCGAPDRVIMRVPAPHCAADRRLTRCSRFIRAAAPAARRNTSAAREPLEIPEIREHTAAGAGMTKRRSRAALEIRQRRRLEHPGGRERLDGAVAGPRRDERDGRRAAIERERHAIARSTRPARTRGMKGDADEQEHARLAPAAGGRRRPA